MYEQNEKFNKGIANIKTKQNKNRNPAFEKYNTELNWIVQN